MISRTTKRFRQAYSKLPKSLQRQTRDAYKLFQQDPSHPRLRFKQVHPQKPVYSVRININYRAVGIRDKNEMIWFWIGAHPEYDKLLHSF
ncbi:MAG: type II toxin-antitoxin system RelE family toxin [Thermodesulfobacteriota bacterium]